MKAVQTLTQLEKSTATVLATALGEALGRPVTGLPPGVANSRVPQSDAAVGWIAPSPHEEDAMRCAAQGVPAAGAGLGLLLLEAATWGPPNGETLVSDTLRRVASAGVHRGKNAHGLWIAPSASLSATLNEYALGTPFLSCGSWQPDSTLLTAALLLGAAAVDWEKTALLLRAVSRHPITLCAALTLAHVTRECLAQGTATDMIKAAREGEEHAFSLLGTLPGSLATPAELGHSAMTMALARAQSSHSLADALAPLHQDVANAPDILLCAVLGAMAAEPQALMKVCATVLRMGHQASTALSVILGLTAATHGLAVIPLAWLQGQAHVPHLTAFAQAACSGGKRALPFPAADVLYAHQHLDAAHAQEQEQARKSAPPLTKAQQLGLFGA